MAGRLRKRRLRMLFKNSFYPIKFSLSLPSPCLVCRRYAPGWLGAITLWSFRDSMNMYNCEMLDVVAQDFSFFNLVICQARKSLLICPYMNTVNPLYPFLDDNYVDYLFAKFQNAVNFNLIGAAEIPELATLYSAIAIGRWTQVNS